MQWKRAVYPRALVIAGLLALYVPTYGVLFPSLGFSVGVFVTVPVVVVAWWYGSRGGVAAGLLTYPVNGILVTLLTDSDWSDMAAMGGLLESAAEVLVGFTVGRVRELEVRARQAERRVEAQRRELQRLNERMVRAQESERGRIAKELHDEIGQEATALDFLLEKTYDLTEGDARSNVESAQRIARGLSSRARDLALELRPSMLDDLGLLAALNYLIKRQATNGGVHVTFDHEGLDDRFSPEAETAAYRIVQEALTNVARHAGTDKADLTVRVRDHTLDIRVEDSGAGFDPTSSSSTETAIGLPGIRERVESLGGSLTVRSAPGKGTSLRAELPYGPESAP